VSRYRVYQDPHHPEEPTLQGLKGSTFLSVGCVIAPYVPMQITVLFNSVYKKLRKAGLKVRSKYAISSEELAKLQAENGMKSRSLGRSTQILLEKLFAEGKLK